MKQTEPKTLRELHRIRARIAHEQRGLSARERVQRTRQEANALLRRWGFTLPIHPSTN
ncbi:MAG: hypothetical protein Q8R91_10755 [Candidatus Omnitrophota bacterium]|nr:hypothetical protein [Candidatus Omnitrophota bacterium]